MHNFNLIFIRTFGGTFLFLSQSDLFYTLIIGADYCRTRSHSMTHTHTHTHIHTDYTRQNSSGRMISPLPDNTQHSKRQTSMLPEVFVPAIPASERSQTHTLDRTATGNRLLVYCLFVFLALQPIVFVFSQPGSGLQPPRFRGFLITRNDAPQ